MASELDTFLATLGNPGRYQCFIGFVLMLNVFALAFQNLNMVFLGSQPKNYRCKVRDDLPLNQTIPSRWLDGVQVYNKCDMYADPFNHSLKTIPCNDSYHYEMDDGEWTIVNEWNLVCGQKYKVGLVTTSYFAGCLVGALVLGFFVDRFGRKPVFLITSFCHVIVGVIQFFSSSYIMFTLLKFVHGFLMQGMIAAMHSLTMEQFRQQHRTECALVGNLIWTSGQFVLCLLAYWNRHWRYLYLATSLPSLVTIAYIWLVPESLRWLLLNQRVEEATAVAKKYSRVNNLPEPANTMADEVAKVVARLSKESENGSPNKYNFSHLFRTKYIRRTTLASLYMWFAASVVYYGINFTMPSLGGDKYRNFAISAAVELASRAALYPALKKIGRRLPNAFSFISAGILCIASAILGNAFGTETVELTYAAIGCALLGKAFCSISFACIILLTTELFPTVIRGVAIGACGLANRIGGMAAPQIILLGYYSDEMVPLCLFGGAAIIAGFVTLLMPETLYVSLPDTIEEAELLCSKGQLTTTTTRNKDDNDDVDATRRRVVGLSNKAFEKEG